MLAILADIHGNLAALEAVLADAETAGCKNFLSLGDVVGYHAEPGECIDLLRKRRVINIMGNHDGYMVDGASCPRSKIVSQIMDYQRKLVSTDQVEWLAQSVPDYRIGHHYFVHGGPNDTRDQYLYVVSARTIPESARTLFSGHTHVQVLARFGERAYCNPGSVGQPRDGDPRASYAILDGDEVVLRRVAYDVERTVDSMKRAGFEPFCYENLYIGAQIGGRIDRVRLESEG